MKNLKKKLKKLKLPTVRLPKVTRVTVAVAALAVTLGALGLELQNRLVPKYSAGTCLVSETAPVAYIIEKVEGGRYKGTQVALMFGLPLDMPIAALNAMDKLVRVNCDTGQPQ